MDDAVLRPRISFLQSELSVFSHLEHLMAHNALYQRLHPKFLFCITNIHIQPLLLISIFAMKLLRRELGTEEHSASLRYPLNGHRSICSNPRITLDQPLLWLLKPESELI